MHKILLDAEENGGGGGGNKEQQSNVSAEGGAGTEGEDGSAQEADTEMEFFEDESDGDDKSDKSDKGKGAGKTDVAPVVQSNYSRFKEVLEVEEELDEEKAFTHVKSLKDENSKLRIMALGRDAIDKDKQILSYRGALGESNENLAYMVLVHNYVEADIPEAQAKIRAKAEIEDIKKKETGAKEIESMALEAKRNVKASLKTREAEIIKMQKDAQSAIDLRPRDSKVTEIAKSEVAKLNSFMGFKLPEQHKGKMVKAVQDYIGSEQERKDLNDPVLRAKFAMLRVHEGQWEKNVQSRKSGKAQVVQKMFQQPNMKQGKGPLRKVRAEGQGNGRIMKNPSAFLKKSGAV